MDALFVYFPLYNDFEYVFSRTVSVKVFHISKVFCGSKLFASVQENVDFLTRLQKYLTDKKWEELLNGF